MQALFPVANKGKKSKSSASLEYRLFKDFVPHMVSLAKMAALGIDGGPNNLPISNLSSGWWDLHNR